MDISRGDHHEHRRKLEARWPVFEDGYFWRGPPSDRRLSPAFGGLSKRGLRVRYARSHERLFEDFATLALEERALVEWANEHGMLTEGDDDDRSEPWALWREQVWAARAVWYWWTGIQAAVGGDDSLLRERVMVEDGLAYDRAEDGLPDDFRSPPLGPLATTTTDAFVGIAATAIGRIVNERLELARPYLVRDGVRFNLQHVPTTLLGAIWLQAAQKLATGAAGRLCEWCARPMPVTTSGSGRLKRADAKYCTEQCGNDAWNDRVAKQKREQRGKQL